MRSILDVVKLTKRQKKYREYLKSEHWSSLRDKALARDGGKCVRCGSIEWLQVHHLCYRGRPEDSLLGDLETVCRACHRKEHGIGPSDFAMKARQVLQNFAQEKLVTPADWKELKSLIEDADDLMDFGDVMFQYTRYVFATKVEGRHGWWMDEKKNRKWFERAFHVRESIWERSL